MSFRSTSTCSKTCMYVVWWMTILEHSDRFELELPSGSFLWPFSSNALPLLPCNWMCFEAYNGPQHRLNHLFRTHHLQALVALLTSFSDAPKAPGSAVSILGVTAKEVGRSSPPTPATGPFCLNTSLHQPHRCSCSLFPTEPPACNNSLMLPLGEKEGVSSCSVLRCCKY